MISVDKVFEQAEEYGHSLLREYAFLIAHSMLHLFGYDHMEEVERKEMEMHQKNDYGTCEYYKINVFRFGIIG